MRKSLAVLCVLVLVFTVACLADPTGEESGEASFPEASQGLLVQGDMVIFPEPGGLAQIRIDTLGADLPSAKGDGYLPVILTLTAGGASLKTYGKIRVQGSSTAKWPKKNWSFKFFADAGREEELRLKIGDSIPSNKWIAKAEWIDPSLLRNALSFRLWEAMVESRPGWPRYEVDHAWMGCENIGEGLHSGAQGFPKTHPLQVLVNGEHYGLALLLLGHDPDNFNIDAENPHHAYLEFDARYGYTKVKTWEKFSAEGIGEWVNGYCPENEAMSDQLRASIDRLGAFFNSSLEEFARDFDRYLDRTNMIDMLLFMETIYDWDAVAQDIEMVSYDLEKWYLLPWDKDTTFGMHWRDGLLQDSAGKLLLNYQSEDPTQKPWFKTYHSFRPEVEARYAQLREEGIFSAPYLYQLAGGITGLIPRELWELERERWEGQGRPALEETSPWQVVDWFEQRLDLLDRHFDYRP